MTKLIVYTLPREVVSEVETLPAGHLFVVTPCYNQFPGMKEDEVINIVIAKDIPDDADMIKVVDKKNFPTDRNHRAAWDFSSGKVRVNQRKKQDIYGE